MQSISDDPLAPPSGDAAAVTTLSSSAIVPRAPPEVPTTTIEFVVVAVCRFVFAIVF